MLPGGGAVGKSATPHRAGPLVTRGA